ncbi:MAG TPA: heme ABC transporter ATP-binding protein [Burkholderiaceae bacterium]|nr:heme ABC transporter ATP-binding protein [Burkholderiaceae bacterium]
MLEAHALTVQVGPHRLLDTVDIVAPPGHVTVVIGPNGAGKSTLFHALAGGVLPREGSIALFSRQLRDWPAAALARQRAVLTQNPSLGFDFQTDEVVRLGRIPHARDANRDDDIVKAALATVGLGDLSKRRYLTLSGGEKQRVHIARALAQIWDASPRARCLMLDEPTVNLDFAQKKVALEAVRAIARDGGTVLVVLHELNLAAQFADRLVLLASGRVVAEGPPREVLTPQALEHAYGAPATVFTHPHDGRPVVL